MKETFGQRFLKLRKARNLTQEDIAKKLNISAQAVSKWENDVSSPDISLLSDIASIFNITIDELLGKEINKTEVLPEGKRKDINSMMLYINILSTDGDKVKVNLPMTLIIACVNSGINISKVSSNNKLNEIDFTQIISLVEQGVVGKLVEIESKDGDTVVISVEY